MFQNYIRKTWNSIKLLSFLVFCLCALINTHSANAQINTNKFRVDLVSNNFRACDISSPGYSTVTIQSKQNTATNFTATFDLPDGIAYVASSIGITAQSGSGDFTITELDISNTNQPIFSIQRSSNAAWQINDIVTFRFDKVADCNAVQYSYNGGLFKDVHTINFTDAQGNNSNSDTNLTINSYELLSPYLSVENIETIAGFVGETNTRNIFIKNSGNGSLSQFEHVVIVSDNIKDDYKLAFNGTDLTPTTISGNTFTYLIDLNSAPFTGAVGDGDNLFENETIPLVETLRFKQCAYSEKTIHGSNWGCEIGNYCQIGNTVTGDYNQKLDAPRFSLTEVANPNPDLAITTTHSYNVTNTSSTTNLLNVAINIGIGWSDNLSTKDYNTLYGGDYYNNREFSNFRFLNGSTVTPIRWVSNEDPTTGSGSYLLKNELFTTDLDGPGGLDDLDGDGYFDDLLPGETTQILFDLRLVPYTGVVCDEYSENYLENERINIDVWALNTCGSAAVTKRIEINHSQIRKEGIFNWTNPQDYDPDAEDGDIFHLNFVGNFTVTAEDEKPQCSGTDLLSNNSSTYYSVVVNVPNGVSLDSSADARYVQSGNQITFTETNLADFSNSYGYLAIPIDFPLLIDCSTYTGPEQLNLNYTTSFTSSCYVQELHCGTFEFVTHCDDTCNGPVTTSFEANRETAGWLDDSMVAKVILDPAIHATKYYMAKDEMVIRTSAIMRNDVKDNLYFELQYVTRNGIDMSDIINFTSGDITINDLSGGGAQSTAITVQPTLNTFGTNDNRLTFDLTSYKNIISSSYNYGDGSGNDVIELELHFRFKSDFHERNRLDEFYTFSGNFYSLDNSANKVSCDKYYDRAFFFENKIAPFFDDPKVVNGCDTAYLYYGLAFTSNLEDKFPNEFRPMGIWESTTIEIPQGMTFNGVAGSDNYPELEPEGEDPGSWNNGLNVSVSGNIVTITPGPRFRQLDQGGNMYASVEIEVNATSATPLTSNVNMTVDYIEYAYSDASESKTQADVLEMNYKPAVFSITSSQYINKGNSLIESFDVKICKNEENEINNNWLRIDSGTGFNVTGVFLNNAGVETAVSYSNEGGILIVPFGNLASGTGHCRDFRIEGTYTGATPKTIKVSHNYDCDAYPSSYAGLPYFKERTFTLNPVNAAIQLTILDEPTTTVDTCTNFEIDLEVRNAGEGDLINPIIRFDIPGDISGLLIEDISIEYPRNSGNIESITPIITGNTVEFNLSDHSGINVFSGLPGSISAAVINNQIAIVALTLNPQCNYRSNTGTTYIINANNTYGEFAIGNGSKVATNPIIITGAEPPYSTNSIAVSSPSFAGCDIETVSIETYIVDGTTGTNDYTRIIFPSGLSYVANSFVSTGGVTATFVAVNTVGDHQEIEVKLPIGATPSDIIAYNFGLDSTAYICAGSYDIDLETYVTVSGLSCNGVSCGETEVVTGGASATVSVTKAALAASSYVATAEYFQNSGSNDYFLSFGIENVGTEDLAAGITYSVYCADASGQKTGNLLYTGFTTQVLLAGGSLEENVSFATADYCGDNGNIIVELEPSGTNCFCTPLTLVIASTPTTNFADLELSVVANTATVNPNDQVIFTLTVLNKGPLDATNVAIESLLPIGYTFVSSNSGATSSGSTITWPTFNLAQGASVIVEFTASVNNPTGVGNEYLLISQVTASDQADPDSTPNNYDGLPLEDDEAINTVALYSADLSIDKRLASGSTNTPNVGETISFEIEVVNNGPDAATNVSIEDIIPIGFTVDATSISNGGIIAENTITWNLSAFPSGSLVLLYNVTVNAPTGAANEYMNIAQVTAVDQYDPDSTPNNDDGDQSEDDEDSIRDIYIERADLSIDKRLADGFSSNVSSGDVIGFEILLRNSGPDNATNIRIEDSIPIGYTIDVSSISNSGTLSGNIVTWNIASLASGDRLLTYLVVVNPPTGISGEYKNVVQVTAVDQYDSDSTPNNDDGDQSEDDEDAFETMVFSNVDISISKEADKTTATIGEEVVFTIRAQNIGNATATNIGIDENIPNGFEYKTHVVTSGIYDSLTGEWLIDSLSANETAILTITVEMLEGDEYTNIASLSYLDQMDNNMNNDQDEVTVILMVDESCLLVYNEFSPNNDGANEVFHIDCIDQYPNNFVEVFNRWGTKVFEMKGYNNTWDGTSTGRATINASEKLPVGTYFYTLDLGDGKTKSRSGWLYLTR